MDAECNLLRACEQAGAALKHLKFAANFAMIEWRSEFLTYYVNKIVGKYWTQRRSP